MFYYLATLEVEFEVPETSDTGETVELKATVSYCGELVEDADEVVFETWKHDNKADSTKVEATNQGDGIYTAETTFEKDSIYEMYAYNCYKFTYHAIKIHYRWRSLE